MFDYACRNGGSGLWPVVDLILNSYMLSHWPYFLIDIRMFISQCCMGFVTLVCGCTWCTLSKYYYYYYYYYYY